MSEKKKKSLLKRILLSVLAVFIVLVLVVVGYVVYVFATYYRLEDNIALDVESKVSAVCDADGEYTIVSWNMGFGAYSDDYSFFMDGGKYSRAFSKQAATDNMTAMAARVAELDPDFAIIQEVDINSTRSYHLDERVFLTEKLTGHTYDFAQNFDSPYLFYPIFCPHGKAVSGIMTFSKYNIESALRRSFPVETGVTKLVDLDRCYSVSRIPLSNGKTLCLYNMHLSAYTSDGTIATEQLKMIISDMETEYKAGNYVVCGGDFNKDLLGNSDEIFGISFGDVTWAQPIPEGTIPEWLTLVADSNAPSCRNADRPYDETDMVLTVDGFLVSANVEVTYSAVVDEQFAHSDHNPVIMKFKLK